MPIHWKNEDGALVFFRDITERKLAEEEHRRNQEWLQLYFDLPFIGMASHLAADKTVAPRE